MRVVRRILLVVSILALMSAAGGWSVYQASQEVPEFYERVLHVEMAEASESGDQLEQQVVDLHNELRSGESWELCLSDQQVNGWLVSDLQEKFPNLLPPDVEAPRVAFLEDGAHVACRVKHGSMSTVLSITLIPYLTDEPNEIAIRIARVRAGALPVPLTKILDRVTATCASSGLFLRWSQDEGDPVAIVRLPEERDDLRDGVQLEIIQVVDGQLRVAGTANDTSPHVADSSDELQDSNQR